MRFFAVLCAASSIAAAQQIPPETLVLARIRSHMVDQLHQQPDYTCVETVERSERRAANKKLRPLDTLRLEVALVDGNEMFGWPGAEKFEATVPAEFIRQGAIGNGDFALHARAIFETRNATFEYKGEHDGVLQYDYKVPQLLSGYSIRVSGRHAIVAYHGSIFADAKTLDLRRMEVVADRIPEDLGLAAASDRMDYARVKIGGSDFLLPSESRLLMQDLDGVEHSNHTVFSGCRQFSGESVLRFDDAPESAAPVRIEDVALPGDIRIELTFLDELDTDHAAVGDQVRARLENDIKEKGCIVFSRGAIVLGRITRLDRRSDYTTLGLSFSEIETKTARGHFHAMLEEVPQDWFLAPRHTRSAVHPDPDEGILTLRSGRVRLGRGILMFWRTRKS